MGRHREEQKPEGNKQQQVEEGARGTRARRHQSELEEVRILQEQEVDTASQLAVEGTLHRPLVRMLALALLERCTLELVARCGTWVLLVAYCTLELVAHHTSALVELRARASSLLACRV